jgi:UDP-N-acetylmuramoyl-L-alanyl-D-glutamate--2,6-diaminopimelate ligase
VFTNLGTEHQERHGGFENLRRDKGKIFAQLANTKRKIINGKKVDSVIVANTDDQNADFYLQFGADKKIAFGLQSHQRDVDTVVAKNVASTDRGVSFEVQGTQFNLHIIGEFNVYNALAAIGVAQSQGISYSAIASGLASVSLVEGRMEEVRAGQDFKVIVDYAHEPLSFTELFKSLRQLVGANKKIIAVIGSDGGGRDVGKREKMGEIAGLLTDRVVVTDVNCYEEDPLRIAEMLAVGARKIGKKDGENLFVEVDRRAAIAKAISMAEAGDVVVITAKGTEPYIAVAGGKKIPWDDRLVAKEILLSK